MARKKNEKLIDNGLGEKIMANEVFYLNNSKLPTVGSSYELSPKMRKAWKKAKSDIVYFAQNFFTIVDLSDGKRKKIPLRPYQLEFLKNMQDHNRVVFNTSRQIGKCVDPKTRIRVRLKWLPFLPITIKIGTFYKLMKLQNWLKQKFSRA